MYNLDSKIKEVVGNPVGADILYIILSQLKKEKYFRLFTGRGLGNLKLRTLCFGKKKRELQDLMNTMCKKMNESIKEEIDEDFEGDKSKEWWRRAVVYQIYPRSFKDSNGDGIGDLRGIIQKIGYLKEIGVNALWISPIFDSPNDDNGYDIRDYTKIMDEFGDMNDAIELINECHKNHIRVIMDLVINHTSDEHLWFEKALGGIQKYKDYYFFRKSREGKEPNNWKSLFGGSAWKKVAEEEYFLHLFSSKQADLNWENDQLREELFKIIKLWTDYGVDGFRLDVINFISKDMRFEDGNEMLGEATGYTGIEHYVNGPRIHEFLKELNRRGFQNGDIFTVGECNGLGINSARFFTHRSRAELSTVFTFEHMTMPGYSRWDGKKYDLNYLKRCFIRLQNKSDENCLFGLFTDNHDSPRFIDKILKGEEKYRDELSKAIMTMLLTLRGVPVIYQGQELGLGNPLIKNLEDFKDVESLNKIIELRSKGIGEGEIFEILKRGSRDNARAMMPWSDIQEESWIKITHENCINNVEYDLKKRSSVLNFFMKLTEFRRMNTTVINGKFKLEIDKHNIFVFSRENAKEKLFFYFNLSNSMKKIKQPKGSQLILGNYSYGTDKKDVFRPYECKVLR